MCREEPYQRTVRVNARWPVVDDACRKADERVVFINGCTVILPTIKLGKP